MTTRGFIEPLVQKSTPSIIAEKLRLAIGHGELPAGTQLYEAELARELGVSRGPLREGMQRLTQEGLLISIRNRGLFVIQMTPENVRDMYVARSAIERAAAEQIMQRDPADASEALLSVVDTMVNASARKQRSRMTEADMTFHQTLVSHAHSTRLSRIHETLLTETRMCITALEESYRFSDDRVAEHRDIAEALGAGDTALTDRLLIAHMEDAVRRLTTAVATPAS
ncbi:GntR family transcriptional regulator [Segeticoccus rhizosphaerae]|jgi:DNA-binding GntR family transcriptional regulator|uniref:GntR family transcriptional regulator n=1 Tax=Segeticoccus rhizosphaerae TaxID=1104777 RepID=UPI0010C13F01|nr:MULTISPECIES: GntR family transcriptional regulator [Intrasporangiaceae]